MIILLTIFAMFTGFVSGQTAVDPTGQDRPAAALPIAVLTLEGRGVSAQDYQRRFIWFLPTFAASAGMLYSYENETVEDQIKAGILAGLAAKIIVGLVAGDPRLPDHLVRKINSQSTVYQDNYRRSWLKEVKKIRSNRADSGCLVGLAVGYTALHY